MASYAAHPFASPPPLPAELTSVLGSVKRDARRLAMPTALHLKAAFGELKLDLRDAVFPHAHVLIVAESLCASVTVLLPEGVSVVDHSSSVLSSHKVSQPVGVRGGNTLIHLDGWSVCSDVKLVHESTSEATA
jgi:hypothetical protein